MCLINKAMGGICNIQFQVVDDMPLLLTGKHLYTICELEES